MQERSEARKFFDSSMHAKRTPRLAERSRFRRRQSANSTVAESSGKELRVRGLGREGRRRGKLLQNLRVGEDLVLWGWD